MSPSPHPQSPASRGTRPPTAMPTRRLLLADDFMLGPVDDRSGAGILKFTGDRKAHISYSGLVRIRTGDLHYVKVTSWPLDYEPSLEALTHPQ